MTRERQRQRRGSPIRRRHVMATGLRGLVWALFAIGIQPTQAQTASEVVLHNFGRLQGAQPNAAPVLDSAGNLYGTTALGGPNYAGAIFKIDTAGNYKVLYSFTGTFGVKPNGVTLDAAGNLYGTTTSGGDLSCPINPNWGCGMVYKLDTSGRLTALHSFTDGADGASPSPGVVRDAAGNLYGATVAGGDLSCATDGCGVVFKIDPAGHESVLHAFSGGPDGMGSSGVVRDSAGNLYGTSAGGTANQGLVYKLDPSGHKTVLYNFTGKTDGGRPSSGVILDSTGNLYGTTEYGGLPSCGIPVGSGCGLVYRLDPSGRETALYAFQGGADGIYPVAGVIMDTSGNIYGATPSGGTNGYGVVFKLDPNGHETVLHAFTGGTEGLEPNGCVRDPLGNLYGTTYLGGARNGGVVFKLNPAGHETVLHTFSNGNFGTAPSSGVIGNSAGDLYGTAASGGPAGSGVVYRLSAASSYTVLYSFTGGADGGAPGGGLILDAEANLYGTAGGGNTGGSGVVYKLDPAGKETVLYIFTGGADGGIPGAGVIRDEAGNFYGTTGDGAIKTGRCAPRGCGVVFKLSATGQETVLHTFTGGADGGQPFSGLIRDAAGNLYGTAEIGGSAKQGVVFKLDTGGNYTVLYNFTGKADGGDPGGALIRDAAGNLYGTTYFGGTGSSGVVYKLDAAGRETVLYAFTGGADGANPSAGVIGDSAGNLYGTTFNGGALGCGGVFQLDPAGNQTVLYGFAGYSTGDGCFPFSGLLRDSVGSLFGTTFAGGTRETGTVFKIIPQ